MWKSDKNSYNTGFALLHHLQDCLKKLTSNQQALRQQHVLTLNFDWFIGLSVSFQIGYSDSFGVGLTTPKKPRVTCVIGLVETRFVTETIGN